MRGTSLALLLGTTALLGSAGAQHLAYRNDPKLLAENKARIDEYNRLMERARKAEDRKDLAEAERALVDACFARSGRDDPFAHFELAAFYDRHGRERKAFAEYRVALAERRDGWSSRQEEPRILARYGDLCLRFGTQEEAARKYAFAATRPSRDDYWDPQTIPRSTSLSSLRAAAHTAAAIQLRGYLRNEPAFRELRVAVAADPAYWVPHFYLAQWLASSDRQEAVRECQAAESLAPSPKYREMVRRMRANQSL